MRTKNGTKLMIAIIILALVTLACEFSFSTAEISDVYMSFDENGGSPTTIFGGSDIFYCIVETSGTPDDTVVRVEWYAVDVEDDSVAPNTLLFDSEYIGSGDSNFSLEFDYLWPTGLYRVDVFLNGEFNTSVNFSVAQ